MQRVSWVFINLPLHLAKLYFCTMFSSTFYHFLFFASTEKKGREFIISEEIQENSTYPGVCSQVYRRGKRIQTSSLLAVKHHIKTHLLQQSQKLSLMDLLDVVYRIKSGKNDEKNAQSWLWNTFITCFKWSSVVYGWFLGAFTRRVLMSERKVSRVNVP